MCAPRAAPGRFGWPQQERGAFSRARVLARGRRRSQVSQKDKTIEFSLDWFFTDEEAQDAKSAGSSGLRLRSSVFSLFLIGALLVA